MEAKLQKLKVTELKELLAKNHLVQTGKKDDLVKRLLENNIGVEGDATDDLVDVDDDDLAAEPTLAPPAAADISTQPAPPPSAAAQPAALSPEAQAMKSRAERFGITFNANATPTRTTPSQAQAPSPVTPSASETTTPASTKTKAGAIDPQPLGLSEDVLAKRAAKFGVPEKKAEAVKEAPASATPTKKAEVEVTPEMAERIAVEEEKKRKRAEKFGTGVPAATNGSAAVAEPDNKKTKV